MSEKEIVIIAAKRTAIGSFLGSLSNLKATEMATILTKELIRQLNIEPSLIDELILGQVLQATQGQNTARQVLINAGIGQDKSAFTVNMVCGSGLKAVELGFNTIKLGTKEIVAVGGAENMSLSPFALEKTRTGYKMGDQTLVDTMIKDGLWCAFNHYHMGVTAENLAKQYQISRQEQDEFALYSQQKATQAIQTEKFKQEILPLTLIEKKKEITFSQDEFVRQNASLEQLSKLKPAFIKDGTVTAGNSSGLNDGSAMLLLSSREKAKALGLPVLATLKAFTTVGVDPRVMGIGAAFTAKQILEKNKLKVTDIDLFELNEAFAAQSIATIRELKVDPHKVNINGGAIALGHPIGASGARILTTLIYSLRQNKKSLGLASLCIGGGQGISAVIEIND